MQKRKKDVTKKFDDIMKANIPMAEKLELLKILTEDQLAFAGKLEISAYMILAIASIALLWCAWQMGHELFVMLFLGGSMSLILIIWIIACAAAKKKKSQF